MSAVLFNNPNAFATPILLSAFNQIGMALFDYEPETIELYVKSIAPNAPKATAYKLNAALGLFTTNLFWQDPIQFGLACRTFNRESRVGADAPSLEDLAWGIAEAKMLVGMSDDDSDTFCEAIKAYIKYSLDREKLLTVPDAFQELDIKLKHVDSFDDPQQMQSLQQRSDAEAAALDYMVYTQTIEMLKQVASLNIPFSNTAKEQLNKILNKHEQTVSNVK